MRNDLLFGVSHVDAGFEDFDPQAGEFGPLQAADQLLGFTREHRAAYHFDPTFLAGIFQKHIITALLCFLIPGIGRSLLFDPGDPGSEGVEASVDVLVTAVDLFDVLDRARTFGAHRRDQQRHTRTDVGRSHARSPQPHLVVMSDHRRAMGVAEDDLGPHVDQLIDEKQAAFEHLLVNQHRAFGL